MFLTSLMLDCESLSSELNIFLNRPNQDIYVVISFCIKNEKTFTSILCKRLADIGSKFKSQTVINCKKKKKEHISACYHLISSKYLFIYLKSYSKAFPCLPLLLKRKAFIHLSTKLFQILSEKSICEPKTLFLCFFLKSETHD